MAIFTSNEWTAESFWREIAFPPGLRFQREHRFIVSQRPGRGGADHFEWARFITLGGESKVLIAYRSQLTAKDVPVLKRRLLSVLEERRRSAQDPEDRAPRIPVIATASAQPAVIEACARELVGLIDQTGTVMIHDGPVYVHVEGSTRVKKMRNVTLFRGKGARILRWLLEAPGKPHSIADVVKKTETSIAYASAVLTRLESEGFVHRHSPRKGFRLVRPVELLRAWSDANAQTAAIVEPFYAPATTAADIARLVQRLEETKSAFALTLMSAVPPGDVVTGGLPHGLYLSGDIRAVVESLRLQRKTPHNFLVLRPTPDAGTTSCGVYRSGEQTVSQPQLVLDLIANGGARGREQAEVVLDRWAQQLPVMDIE